MVGRPWGWQGERYRTTNGEKVSRRGQPYLLTQKAKLSSPALTFSPLSQSQQAADFRPDALWMLAQMCERVDDDPAILNRIKHTVSGAPDHETAHRRLKYGCVGGVIQVRDLRLRR